MSDFYTPGPKTNILEPAAIKKGRKKKHRQEYFGQLWLFWLKFGEMPIFFFKCTKFLQMWTHWEYRGVLSKWDIFIKMRIAESPPSLDLERSFYNKSILFLDKNHFFFYYLKLLIPLIPLIQGFEDLFCSSILFSQKERKGKSGSIGLMGSACFAAVLILLQQAINKGSVWNWTNWPDLCCGLWFSMKW